MDNQPASTFPPTVKGCYRNGWQRLWQFFPILLLFFVIAFAAGFGNFSFDPVDWFKHHRIPPTGLAGILYSILVVGPLSFGVAFVNLRAARGERPTFRDFFAPFSVYGNALLGSLLKEAIVIVGFALLIVPGIIFWCRLVFTPYLIVEKKMPALDALAMSWRMTRGRAWTVFLIGLRGFGQALVGLLLLVVGAIPALMWYYLAEASLYHAVMMEPAVANPETAPIAPA